MYCFMFLDITFPAQMCYHNWSNCMGFFIPMCYFMLIKITVLCKLVFTFGAVVFFSSLCVLSCYLRSLSCAKFIVALGAAVWFIIAVCYFMLLKITVLCKLVITLGAVVWFFITTCSFMLLEIIFLC